MLEWEGIKDLQVSIPHRVVHRKLAAETVLLNIQTGHYYGMDETGGRFFEVLRASRTVAAAVDRLTGEFDAPVEQIRRDMLRYCNDLLQYGLIEFQELGEAARTRTQRGS